MPDPNTQVAHKRLHTIEARLNQHGMIGEFTALLPGFTQQNTQTEFFCKSLKKLMKGGLGQAERHAPAPRRVPLSAGAARMVRPGNWP
jgi:hypothetical protein